MYISTYLCIHICVSQYVPMYLCICISIHHVSTETQCPTLGNNAQSYNGRDARSPGANAMLRSRGGMCEANRIRRGLA